MSKSRRAKAALTRKTTGLRHSVFLPLRLGSAEHAMGLKMQTKKVSWSNELDLVLELQAQCSSVPA